MYKTLMAPMTATDTQHYLIERSQTSKWLYHLADWLHRPTSIAPLVTLRVALGALLLYTTIRTWQKGWIKDLYIDPDFHFAFIKGLVPLVGNGMYVVFGAMTAAAVGIVLGAAYRLSVVAYLVLFLYVELLDKTYYLNHYYLVTLLVFWLAVTDGHRQWSIDAWRRPDIRRESVPWWQVGIFKLQLSIVYFFAGLAKVNPDWLLRGQPLATWLPGLYQIPIMGRFLHLTWVAVAFSWMGCLYDLTIWVFLGFRKTRGLAYLAVIVFHVLTAILFPRIGMFPYIMMVSTLIFFSANWHERLLSYLSLGAYPLVPKEDATPVRRRRPFVTVALSVYLIIQLALPVRHLLHDGHLFWNEKGYRFSWRVMLMEKSGHTAIVLRDPIKDEQSEVDLLNYLTPFQAQQMRSQPDMILQFADYLGYTFEQENGYPPEIYVHSKLSLNGRRSQPFTDSSINIYKHDDPIDQGWLVGLRDE